MSRDYKNEFGQEEERFRGRSRGRDGEAGIGGRADSDTVPPRRPRVFRPEESGLETERDNRRGFQAGSAGSERAGDGGKRAAGNRPMAGIGSAARIGSSPMAAKGNGTRAAGGPMAAVGNGTRAAGGPMAAEGNGTRTAGRPMAAEGNGTRTAGGPMAAEGYGTRTSSPMAEGYRTNGSPMAGAGFGTRTASGSPMTAEGYGARTTGGYGSRDAEGARTSLEGQRSGIGASGGGSQSGETMQEQRGRRVYHSPDLKTGEGGRSRDTAFRRSGGSSDGRKSLREAAASADAARLHTQRRRRWIIAAILMEVILLCGIWTTRNLMKKYNMIQRPTDFDIGKESNANLSQEKVESMKGYWTVALFGVDSRSEAVGKGNNADVIIICNINQDNGEIKLVSVFRDTYLSIDDKGTYNKINQAYFSGGPKQAVQALNRNMDLQIDDFATFNWKAVADAINILGGVHVDLSEAEFSLINGFITETVKATGVASVHLKKAGPNDLDGVQAVAYSRIRKIDTDFARTERQRKIIDLSFQKLKQSDFSVVNNVMEIIFPQILSSITLDDVIPAAKNLTKYTIVDTAGFPWARGNANMRKKGACVIPQTLESNVIRLHQFLYGEENYQPSEMVKEISSRISADTDMYNEGKPIDKVGTDGGYIPKPTQAPKVTEPDREETEEDESESDTSETDESIIDGEYEWDLELDENGYPIDPPEDWDFGQPLGRPGESGYPGGTGSYPGGPRPSQGADRPGGSTSPTDGNRYPGGTTPSTGGPNHPGGTTPPTGGPNHPGGTTPPTGGPDYPGGTISPGDSPRYPGGDESSGPGGGTPRPTSPSPSYPGGSQPTEPDGPGSIIIGPGQ